MHKKFKSSCERINLKKKLLFDWNELNFVIIFFTDGDCDCGSCCGNCDCDGCCGNCGCGDCCGDFAWLW